MAVCVWCAVRDVRGDTGDVRLAVSSAKAWYASFRRVSRQWRAELFDAHVVALLRGLEAWTASRVVRTDAYDGQHLFQIHRRGGRAEVFALDDVTGRVEHRHLVQANDIGTGSHLLRDANTGRNISARFHRPHKYAGSEIHYDWSSGQRVARITYHRPHPRAISEVHFAPDTGKITRADYKQGITAYMDPVTKALLRAEYNAPHPEAGATMHYDGATGRLLRVDWTRPHAEAGRSQHYDACTGTLLRVAFALPHAKAGTTVDGDAATGRPTPGPPPAPRPVL